MSFTAEDKEWLRAHVDKRFEQIDQRLEQLDATIKKDETTLLTEFRN